MRDEYTECTSLCQPGDFVCIAVCNREYNENIENCPCNANCPRGCPCENYFCDATTTTTALSSTSTTSTSTAAATTKLRALKSNYKTDNSPTDLLLKFKLETSTERLLVLSKKRLFLCSILMVDGSFLF